MIYVVLLFGCIVSAIAGGALGFAWGFDRGQQYAAVEQIKALSERFKKAASNPMPRTGKAHVTSGASGSVPIEQI